MSFFNRSRKSEVPRLLEETNALLRELIQVVSGNPAKTESALSTPTPLQPALQRRLRTEKDVFVVTRKSVIEREQAAREQQEAPWRSSRNGQGSEPPKSNGSQAEPSNSPIL